MPSETSRFADEAVLVGRVLLVLLFLVFGWMKLNDLPGTVDYMTHTGLFMPTAAAWLAIIVELSGALVLALGVSTRHVAILLAVYTLTTGLLGHPYWTMTGAARYGNMINFYKNVSIVGGCLLLYVTGAGRYSVDALRRRRTGTSDSGLMLAAGASGKGSATGPARVPNKRSFRHATLPAAPGVNALFVSAFGAQCYLLTTFLQALRRSSGNGVHGISAVLPFGYT